MAREDAVGLRLCGYHTLNSCRLEKGYRHWGHDINDLDTSVEAGLGFACAMDKSIAFIGREKVAEQKRDGVSRRVLQFALEDPEPLLHHNETIYRDGEAVGYVTSGSYGYTLGGAVGLGIVNHAAGETAASLCQSSYDIDIAGTRFAATASARSMYDPKSERVRS